MEIISKFFYLEKIPCLPGGEDAHFTADQNGQKVGTGEIFVKNVFSNT